MVWKYSERLGRTRNSVLRGKLREEMLETDSGRIGDEHRLKPGRKIYVKSSLNRRYYQRNNRFGVRGDEIEVLYSVFADGAMTIIANHLLRLH